MIARGGLRLVSESGGRWGCHPPLALYAAIPGNCRLVLGRGCLRPKRTGQGYFSGRDDYATSVATAHKWGVTAGWKPQIRPTRVGADISQHEVVVRSNWVLADAAQLIRWAAVRQSEK